MPTMSQHEAMFQRVRDPDGSMHGLSNLGGCSRCHPGSLESLELGMLGDGEEEITFLKMNDYQTAMAMIDVYARPVYLRVAVKSRNAVSLLRDYAAAGFHVSVARGWAGGCKDAVINFCGAGTQRNCTCQNGLGDPELRKLWEEAAREYQAAFRALLAKQSPAQVLSILMKANDLADWAYQAEGLDPPTDPQGNKDALAAMVDSGKLPGESAGSATANAIPAAASVKKAGFPWWIVAAGAAIVVGVKIRQKRKRLGGAAGTAWAMSGYDDVGD